MAEPPTEIGRVREKLIWKGDDKLFFFSFFIAFFL